MSRRALIADAAISTLARDGMRGLTHRAVDRTAGLPEGSASYYFRTRQALLQATVERLVARADRELAHGLGNLVHRTVALVHRHGGRVSGRPGGTHRPRRTPGRARR